jgi:hypothetical protein
MLLTCLVSYFFTHTLRTRNSLRVLPTGNLEPEHAEVLLSLRPENWPYFDDFTRGPSIPWKEHVLRRNLGGVRKNWVRPILSKGQIVL